MVGESNISVPRPDNVGPELGAKPLAAQAAKEAVRISLEHLKEKRARRAAENAGEEAGKGKAPKGDGDKADSKKKKKKKRKEEAKLNEGLEETFPASDVPASINPTR